MSKPETIMIDEVKYVRADCLKESAKLKDGMPYCIVRTYSAGVFAGYLKSRNGQEGIIVNSRGLWYWDGACGLSQLAVDGTSAPDNCKFTVVTPERELTQIIEIIKCTEKAKLSIQNVPVWRK